MQALTRFIHRCRRVPLLALLALSASIACAQQQSAPQAIRNVIATTYDQPGNPVATEPIAIAGNFAIADWEQGDKAGRALLRKKKGDWEIMVCGGADLKDLQVLKDAGLPAAVGTQLVDSLTRLEKLVAPERVKRFDLFRQGTAEPAAGHHGHGKH